MERYRRSLRRRLTLLGVMEALYFLMMFLSRGMEGQVAGCTTGFFSETVMLMLVLAAGAQLLVCVAVKMILLRMM